MLITFLKVITFVSSVGHASGGQEILINLTFWNFHETVIGRMMSMICPLTLTFHQKYL
jgi:hypothetical protein